MKVTMFVLLVICLLATPTRAGPTLVGLCYSACNAGYVACMAGSGLTAGVAGPVGWWAWLTSAAAACSAAQGACMAACTTLVVAPTI